MNSCVASKRDREGSVLFSTPLFSWSLSLSLSFSLSLSLTCSLFCLFLFLFIRTAESRSARHRGIAFAEFAVRESSRNSSVPFFFFLQSRSAGNNSQSLAIFSSVAAASRAHTYTDTQCCTRVKLPAWRTAKGLISSHLVAF